MDWYYAIKDEKHGPVSATRLAELGRGGTLLADDLAWREGLLEWRPFHQVAGEIFSQGAETPVETAVCAHSRRVLPVAEMIPYGDQWIDPQHKDAFLQRLMESGDTATWRARHIVEQTPVGFWTRFLALSLDHLILLIPSLLCWIPHLIASSRADHAPGDEWSPAMTLTHILGLLAIYAIHATYHTWMIGGKHRATLGKQAFGAIVTRPDGGRVTHLRAFARFLALSIVNLLFFLLCVGGGTVITTTFLGSLTGSGVGAVIVMMFTFLPLTVLFSLVGLLPFCMAGLDSRKRALHDRISATVVIRKAP